MKQLAIPLGYQKTAAKWLVISWQTTPTKSLVNARQVAGYRSLLMKQYGHPMLRGRHLPFSIGAAERD